MDEKKNNTAETPAFKAPENAPVRRVGTLTLGVCLIVCGVLFLCYFFVPHFNWELALKIAPAAGLILLGCEVLYFAARPQRWKYDFLSVLLCIVIIVFLFPRQLGLTEDASFAVSAMFRLRCVRDELLTGAMIFSAVFLLNEPYTCAHHRLGRILYGIMVGAFTMGFRYFGVYETGVCFALLAVNSISGWLDRTEVHLYELLHSSWKKQTGKGDAV